MENNQYLESIHLEGTPNRPFNTSDLVMYLPDSSVIIRNLKNILK